MIGAAEVVPGVSGGTIALIVGIYRTLIDQAAHLVRAAVLLFREGPNASWQQIRTAKWGILIPVGIGMVTAVLVGAALIEPFVEEHPIPSRGLFFGLVLAGLYVPYSMVRETEPGAWRPRDYALAAVGFVIAFIVTGVPPNEITDPSPVVIVLGAAVAVSALVLPGLSGSFMLLAMGLYTATLAAVNERDFAYLALFATGMVIGLASFVMVLQWLLDHRARVTLVVLTGVMAGSLRAMWPWQTEDRQLLAPNEQIGAALACFAIGFGLVVSLLAAEKRFRHRLSDEPSDPEHLRHEV